MSIQSDLFNEYSGTDLKNALLSLYNNDKFSIWSFNELPEELRSDLDFVKNVANTKYGKSEIDIWTKDISAELKDNAELANLLIDISSSKHNVINNFKNLLLDPIFVKKHQDAIFGRSNILVVPEEAFENEDIYNIAIKQISLDNSKFSSIPESMFNNLDFVKKILIKSEEIYFKMVSLINTSFLEDKTISGQLLSKGDSSCIQFIPKSIRNNEEMMFLFFNNKTNTSKIIVSKNIKYLGEELLQNKKFLVELLKENPYYYGELVNQSPLLINEEGLAIEYLKQNPMSLCTLPEELYMKTNVASAAINSLEKIYIEVSDSGYRYFRSIDPKQNPEPFLNKFSSLLIEKYTKLLKTDPNNEFQSSVGSYISKLNDYVCAENKDQKIKTNL